MNGVDRSSRFAEYIGGLTQTSIFAIASIGFLAVYLPLLLILIGADYYVHIVDTVSVILTLALATAICWWVARVRLPKYDASDHARLRENRGWQLIATGTLTVLIARMIYAVAEFRIGLYVDSITVADTMFGVSFIFYVVGLMMIPWGERQRRFTAFLLDATIILVAVGAMFWPFLIGPAVQGAFQETLDNVSLSSYFFAAFILTFTILWIVLRDVRDEMWPVAVAFVLAIGALVLTVIGYLAFVAAAAEGNNGPLALLLINAATALANVLIAVAGVLRINVISSRDERSVDSPATAGRPVHYLQIMLPYLVLGLLVALWISMDVYSWRTDFRTGVAVGAAVVTALIIVRQVPMLQHNQKLYRRVAEASIRDGLTGLYGHRAVHDMLRAEIEAPDETPDSTAVLFIDIDFFKKYNDTYGHKQGDQLLVSVARLLVSGVRPTDIVGRYGGEEFMVIAPKIDRRSAEAMAERLRQMVETQRFIQNGSRSSVTVSVGVALYPEDALEPDELIDLADQAMYRAKAAGRNQMIAYSGVS